MSKEEMKSRIVELADKSVVDLTPTLVAEKLGIHEQYAWSLMQELVEEKRIIKSAKGRYGRSEK